MFRYVADSRPINTENRTTQLTDPTANALKGSLVMSVLNCISHAVPRAAQHAEIRLQRRPPMSRWHLVALRVCLFFTTP